MHIYEGGDSSTMQEHLEQKGGGKSYKKSHIIFWLKITPAVGCAWLLPELGVLLDWLGKELWPFMPLPSSWKVLRTEPCSSVCSLPEEATLLWGERGAWSVGIKFCRPTASSWLTHSDPQAWELEEIMDMDFFWGLGCICPQRPGKGNISDMSNNKKKTVCKTVDMLMTDNSCFY